MNNKTILTFLLSSFFFFSCALTPNTKIGGIANLKKKQEILKIGVTNKNDTITYLGETVLKEYPGDSNWAYIETEVGKNIFGITTLIKNNVLLLSFDSKGVLSQKYILSINDIKTLQTAPEFTKSQAISESFSKKFFTSMRKRFLNKQNK